jgi:phospholipase A-2-activating protein
MNIDWDLAHAFTVDDGVGVRCACELPLLDSDDDDYRIVIGTQSGAMYQWSLPSKSLLPIPYQHDNGIASMISSASASGSGSAIYVTGCKDSKIRIFHATTHVLLKTLQGHTKPVTSLSWVTDSTDNKQYLLSGSWDGTAKVWNVHNGAMLATLPDHENSVCVTGLPSTSPQLSVATGSAGIAQNNAITNHSVRLWSIDLTTGGVKLMKTVANDHEGPIRGMALIGSKTYTDSEQQQQQLATCSNDGTVKIRQVETGDCTKTLAAFATVQQEAPMLLSVTATPSSVDTVAAASAEDGHVVFYKNGADSQLVRHGASVWQVLSLSNGDVATSCQDGYVRIFTQATDRMASEAVRDEFAAAVQAASAATAAAGGPSPEEVAKLPKWELNALQQGKKEGQVQCFQKDGIAIAAQWSAVSATWIEVGQVVSGPGGGSASTIDGVEYDHVLPIEVDQEGGGVAKLQIGYNNGENAFVAAQRFMDAHMMPQHYHSEIANYIQQRVGKPSVPTLGGAAAAGPSTVVAPAVYEHVPMKGYKSFELSSKTGIGYFDKILGKIEEVAKLSAADIATLKEMTTVLAATNRYHASQIDPAAFRVLETILTEWPPAQAFPALDLARLAVLHPSTQTSWNWSKLITLAYAQCATNNNEVAAVPLLTLRLVANCFPAAAQAVDLAQAMALTESLVSNTKNKNIRLSAATVLLNVSSYLHLSPDSVPPTAMAATSRQIVVQINAILGLFKVYESEAMARALVALGTVLLADPTTAKEVATTLYLTSKVEMAASPHGDKAKAIAREVYTLLQ